MWMLYTNEIQRHSPAERSLVVLATKVTDVTIAARIILPLDVISLR